MKKALYLPHPCNGTFDYGDDDDVDQTIRTLIARTPVGAFHIGQPYDKAPAELVQCTKCGGTAFQVGQGSDYTAIRCVTCRWELGIHEG